MLSVQPLQAPEASVRAVMEPLLCHRIFYYKSGVTQLGQTHDRSTASDASRLSLPSARPCPYKGRPFVLPLFPLHAAVKYTPLNYRTLQKIFERPDDVRFSTSFLGVAALAATVAARSAVDLSPRDDSLTIVSPKAGATYYAFSNIDENGGKTLNYLNITLTNVPKNVAAFKFSLQGDSKVPPTYQFGIDAGGDLFSEDYLPKDGYFTANVTFPDPTTNGKIGSSAQYTFTVQKITFDCATGNPTEVGGPFVSDITLVQNAPPS